VSPRRARVATGDATDRGGRCTEAPVAPVQLTGRRLRARIEVACSSPGNLTGVGVGLLRPGLPGE
jgi:hypothetical protein